MILYVTDGFDLDVLIFQPFGYTVKVKPVSLKTITHSVQTNYRPIKIGKIKSYFNNQILYQQLLTNELSKHLTFFDYTDKILTVFLTVLSGTNIFAHVKGRKQLLGLITSAFSLLFCLSSGITKKLYQETKLRKKKHNRLLYLAKKKLDCVEMLVSKSVQDGIIDHDEFLAIMKEKKYYDSQNFEIKLKLRLFKFFFFLSIIRMVVVTFENYLNARVHTVTVKNKDYFWVKMEDVQNNLGLKNLPCMVRRKICGKFETDKHTEEQKNNI